MHKLHLDRAEETEAHVLEALRISPRDANVSAWFAVAGFAKDWLCRYDEAIAWQRRSIESNGNYPTAHFHLAMALAHLGRLEEARAAARAGLTLNPHLTIASYREANIFSNSPAHLAWRERQFEGLRRAGSRRDEDGVRRLAAPVPDSSFLNSMFGEGTSALACRSGVVREGQVSAG